MKKKIFAGALLLALSALFVGAAYRGMPGKDDPQEKSERSEKGWLGVSIRDIDSHLKKAKGLKSESGAYVNDVTRKSPAYAAGIRDEDVIVEVDGKTIEDAGELQRVISKTKPGTKVRVAIMREGEKKNFEVTLGKLPGKRTMAFGFGGVRPRIEVFQGGMYGLSLKALNEQLGEYFGVPEGKGVLVEEVEKNSEADKAGFKAGDVITQVGKRHVGEIHDIMKALSAYDDGEKADFEIYRKGSHKTLTIEVKEDEEHFGNGFWFNTPSAPHRFREFNMIPQMPDMDFDFPDIDFEGFRPEMDELRFNLDGLKQHLRGQQFEIQKRIEQDLKPKLRMETSKVI